MADVANELYQQNQGQPTIWITSVEDKFNQVTGGRVFETTLHTAAQRIVGKTHRVSTPEEIAAEKEYRAKEVARLAREEESRKENTSISERTASLIGQSIGDALTSDRQHSRAKDKQQQDK